MLISLRHGKGPGFDAISTWECHTVHVKILQEHIEPAKPAREHMTTIDGEIQTWLPDTNFSNIQIWKGNNVRMHSCILRVP